MLRRPPRTTRPDPLLPAPTLFRSTCAAVEAQRDGSAVVCGDFDRAALPVAAIAAIGCDGEERAEIEASRAAVAADAARDEIALHRGQARARAGGTYPRGAAGDRKSTRLNSSH